MIYLDNAATSYPKASGIKEAICKCIDFPHGNVGRSAHEASAASSRILFEARDNLASFMNFSDDSACIFTKSATESINLVVKSQIQETQEKNLTILTSPMEHNSVSRVLSEFLNKKRITVLTFRCDPYGFPDLEDMEKQLRENSISFLVSTAASNVTGAVFPIEKICKIAKKNNIPICLDASQLVGEAELDFSSMPDGAVCFSAHKGLLAPPGVGICYLSGSFRPIPLIFGGTGSNSESTQQPKDLPDYYEAGTPNFYGITGLSAALNYIRNKGNSFYAYKDHVSKLLYNGLKNIEELNILSPELNRVPIISAAINKKNCKENSSSRESLLSKAASYMSNNDIAIRFGLHCAPSAHKHIGTFQDGGTIRFSPGFFTTEKEIKKTVNTVKDFFYENT